MPPPEVTKPMVPMAAADCTQPSPDASGVVEVGISFLPTLCADSGPAHQRGRKC
jgi:hypothetical protein